MTSTDQFRWMDATAQAALIKQGEVSPNELINAAISQIDTLNPHPNAIMDSPAAKFVNSMCQYIDIVE